MNDQEIKEETHQGLSDRLALLIVITTSIFMVCSFALLFFISNRVLLLIVPIVTGVAVFVLSRYLDEFLFPDPDSVDTMKSRKIRFIGGTIWSFAYGIALGRFLYINESVSSSPWPFIVGFLIAFIGAMIITVFWTLSPRKFITYATEIVDRGDPKYIGRLYEDEEEELED